MCIRDRVDALCHADGNDTDNGRDGGRYQCGAKDVRGLGGTHLRALHHDADGDKYQSRGCLLYTSTDWYDEVYNPKLMQEHSITLTGADKRTRDSLNATDVDNPGLVVNSGMKKYYMRSNLESQVASFLAVGLNAWGYHCLLYTSY